MNNLSSTDLWQLFRQLSSQGNSKLAAVSYVTDDRCIHFNEGDVLITDASNHAIKSGQTDASLLAAAVQRGALVYSYPGLHAKVMVLGGKAIIGSANISQASRTSLLEAAWVSDNPATVGQVIAFIQQLAKISQPVNSQFVSRILRLKVTRRTATNMARGHGRRKRLRKTIQRSWLVSVTEMSKESPGEEEAIDAGEKVARGRLTDDNSDVAWVRWIGKSRFRKEAGVGDTVIQIWTAKGRKRPDVYRHAPILHRQEERNCTRFYVEEASDMEATALSWGGFQRLVKRVGISRKVVKRTCREISQAHSDALYSLWTEVK